MAEPTGKLPGQWVVVASAAAAALLYWLLPGSVPHEQRVVASVFLMTVCLWVTEALPLAATALLSTTLLVVLGGLEGKSAFGAFGDQIILLFVGSFLIAKSMEDTGLARRVAFGLLSRRWASRSARSMLWALGVVSCLVSLFVSNTATTAMLLPVGITILRAVGRETRGDPVAHSFLLMLTWGSSVAVGTVVGTPPNVIGVAMLREEAGIRINFVQWMVFAMPLTAVLLFAAWILLGRWRGPKLDTGSARKQAEAELRAAGPLSHAEWGTIAAFGVALALWVLPGLVEYALGADHPATKAWAARVPEAVAALLGATVLFLWPDRCREGGRLMTWPQAAQIDWGTILLFAGGMALGKAAFESGLAEAVGVGLAKGLALRDVWAITALMAGLAVLLSELASNTAAATTLVPVAIAVAEGAGVSPVAPAVGVALGSSLGFMLPVSTAPNAIVYSSGLLPTSSMVRNGIVFDVVGWLATVGCLWLFLPLAGIR